MPKFYASGSTKHHDLSENLTNSLTIARNKAMQDQQGFEVFTEDSVMVASVTPKGKVFVTDFARAKFLKGSQPAYLRGQDSSSSK